MSRHMKSVAAFVKALRLALLAALAVSSASAETIISSQAFSIGYGARSGAVSFTTTETGSANTPTTQGDFKFIPTVSGGWFSSAGPFFNNRVLTNGDVSNGYTANAATFGLSITGTYTGAVPDGYTPNISLNISNLVVRGVGELPWGATTIRWTETTSGASQTSPNVSLNLATNSNTYYATASNYTALSWDPVDFYTDNSRSQTRTFAVSTITAGGQNNAGLDGLEIFGTVDVVLVPEPATTLLLGSGLVGLWLGRRRSRR
jgi:hypothetical protein